MSIHRIPAELIHPVLSHILDGPKAKRVDQIEPLLQCALVSRRFLAPSRELLFSTIDVNIGFTYSEGEVDEQTMELIQLLEHPNTSFVHPLSLRMYMLQTSRCIDSAATLARRYIISVFERKRPRIRSLSLILSSLSQEEREHAVRVLCNAAGSDLESLHLRGPVDIPELLLWMKNISDGRFPKLTSLAINDIGDSKELSANNLELISGKAPSTLTTLTVTGLPPALWDEMLNWFRRGKVSLKRLELWEHPDRARAQDVLKDDMCAELVTLDLVGLAQRLDLSRFQSLTTVRLSIWLPAWNIPSQVQSFAAALETVSSLKHRPIPLTIEFSIWGTSHPAKYTPPKEAGSLDACLVQLVQKNTVPITISFNIRLRSKFAKVEEYTSCWLKEISKLTDITTMRHELGDVLWLVTKAV